MDGMGPNRSVPANGSPLIAVEDAGSDGMEKVPKSKDGALLSGLIMGVERLVVEDELLEALAGCAGTSRGSPCQSVYV